MNGKKNMRRISVLVTAQTAYNLDKLAFFTIDDPPLACPLAIVYKKNGFISPMARAFIDVTKDYYRRFHQAAGAVSAPVQS